MQHHEGLKTNPDPETRCPTVLANFTLKAQWEKRKAARTVTGENGEKLRGLTKQECAAD